MPINVTIESIDVVVKPMDIKVYYPIGEEEVSNDKDGDGIPDSRELELGLNPNSKDSDGDGILDNIEIGDIINPLDTD